MQTRCCITLCLIAFVVVFHGAIEATAAQPASREPIVSLTVNNVPLGEALATLSQDTGYRFHLNSQWKAHPVSVDIANIPLEEALKRLLRNLNHSIVWESEDSIRIMVYGASDGAGSAHAISFSAPPQEVPEEIAPFDAAEEEVEEYVEPSAEEGAENDAIDAPEETVPPEETAPSDADAGDDLQEETSPEGD